MTLIDIQLAPPQPELPTHIAGYLEQMAPQIEHYRSKTPGAFRGFVPSDYNSFYWALAHLAERRLACGELFCEWGSGLGVSTCLASMLGFDASGIEIDERLVDAAERFASEFDVDATFVHGSFLPQGVDELVDDAFADNDGEISMISDADDAYDRLGLELEDFDVVFSFPWPTDAELTAEVFERFASVGALLLTFDEGEGYRVRRK